MSKKYELTDETRSFEGRTLYRIRAVAAIAALGISAGDFGGWVESEHNLTQAGNAWVFDNACVYENSQVSDNACIYDDARIYGNSRVYENASIYGNSHVFGNAHVYGDAYVFDKAHLDGNSRVFGKARVCDDGLVTDDAWIEGDAEIYGAVSICGKAWIKTTPIRSVRSDAYDFALLPMQDGSYCVSGDSGLFTLPEARQHSEETHGGTMLGIESQSILDHFERMIVAQQAQLREGPASAQQKA